MPSAALTIRALWLLFCAPAFAQGVHFGLKVGIPITPYFETGRSGSLHGSAEYSAATRRYTLGPAFEWRWTRTFGLEVDALYHRMGYVALVNSFDSAAGNFRNSAVDIKGNSWDVPLMFKYRFGRRLRPYGTGGAVLRYVGPVRGRGRLITGSLAANTSSTTPLDTSQPSELRKRVYPGLTAAAGLELAALRIRLLPEFRYTRWTANITGPGGLLRFAPNQAEFLVGVLF